MTMDDVRQLDAVLRRRGMPISANIIVAKLGGSKRDATEFLRQVRAGAPQAIQTPVPARHPASPLEPTPAAAASLAPVPPASLVPPAPAAHLDTLVAACAPPPTLLQQAEARLRAAIAEEHRIRRGVQSPGQPITWSCLERCQETTRQAQALVDKLQRSQASLSAAIPAARIDARRAAGELAALEEETRRRLLRARREAQQAHEALDRMVQDLTQIAGAAAVPAED